MTATAVGVETSHELKLERAGDNLWKWSVRVGDTTMSDGNDSLEVAKNTAQYIFTSWSHLHP